MSAMPSIRHFLSRPAGDFPALLAIVGVIATVTIFGMAFALIGAVCAS